jgi:endonuclease G
MTTGICREGYYSMFDTHAKIPAWVAWRLTPKHILGCEPRSNAFSTDQSVPNSSTPADYAGSGYDQGHLANNNHQSWSPSVEHESFIMTNMSPQTPAVNRGAWKLLETSTGAWSYQLSQDFDIIAGNIYSETDRHIGSGVIVPHSLWKVAINMSTMEYAAWIFPNQGALGNDLTQRRILLTSLIALSHVSVPLPLGAHELAVGKEWPLDFAALARAKKLACPRSTD